MKSVIPFLLLLGSSTAFCQWNVNPNQNNAVCALSSVQEQPRIIADGNGGAFVAWTEERKEDRPKALYVQQINATGQLQWTAGGLTVAESPIIAEDQCMVGDGNGGFIITWLSYAPNSDNNIYAQHISANGIPQWTTDGVPVCTESGQRYSPRIVSDGKGGAVISWVDARSGGNKVYAQAISAAGIPQWQPGGVALSGASSSYDAILTSDHAGGAIVAWDIWDAQASKIYAQRVDATGTLLWQNSGVLLCAAPGIRHYPQIVSDNAHGAIVVWTDLRHGFYKPALYAQRINAAGNTQWVTDGALMHKPDVNYWAIVIFPDIVSDGNGGVIGAWQDGRNGNDDIYAQRLDGNGQKQWAPGGEAICTDTNTQGDLHLCEDGRNGAVITWTDYRNSMENTDIYAQHITYTGNKMHPANGLALSTAINSQSASRQAYTGRNGLVITAWEDHRRHNGDIYATALSVGAPLAPLAGHSKFTAPDATMTLAPNPAQNTLYLSHIPVASNLLLTDVYGRVLRNLKAESAQLSLDISNLAQGIYFIKTDAQSLKFIKR